MNRRMPGLPVLLLVLTACGGGGGAGDGPAPAADIDVAAYAPFTAGARWVYDLTENPASVTQRRLVSRVLTVDSAGGRLDVGGSADDVQSATASGRWAVRQDSQGTWELSGRADAVGQALGPTLVLPARTAVGQTHRLFDRQLPGVADFDGDGREDAVDLRADATTIGREAVTTPAGRFDDTLHLRTVVTQTVRFTRGAPAATVTTTADSWYAEGVGLVREATLMVSANDGRVVFRSERQLLAFAVGSRRSESQAPELTMAAPPPVTGSLFDVQVRAGEAIDLQTLGPDVIALTGPDGQVVPGRFHATSTELHFVPTVDTGARLASGTYRVTLRTPVSDLIGNSVQDRSWSFEVDSTPPSVQAVSVPDGGTYVPLDAAPTIDFSEPVLNQGQVRLIGGSTTIEIPLDLSIADRRMTARPRVPLEAGTEYQLVIDGTTVDPYGNLLGATRVVTFRTDPGRFDYGVVLDAGPIPGPVALADVDGDGRADLLTTVGDDRATPGIFENRLRIHPQAAGGGLAPPRVLRLAGGIGCLRAHWPLATSTATAATTSRSPAATAASRCSARRRAACRPARCWRACRRRRCASPTSTATA